MRGRLSSQARLLGSYGERVAPTRSTPAESVTEAAHSRNRQKRAHAHQRQPRHIRPALL